MTTDPLSNYSCTSEPVNYIELEGEIPPDFQAQCAAHSALPSEPMSPSQEHSAAPLNEGMQCHNPDSVGESVEVSRVFLPISQHTLWQLIPLALSLLIILLLFPQFLLSLRGALLELFFLLRILLLPILALGSALFLLFIFYARSR